MKLNFSNEALAENGLDNMQEASILMGGADAALQEFPSLKDLETSNMVTNKFMGGRAAHFALQAMDSEKSAQLGTLKGLLSSKASVSFNSLVDKQASRAGSKRKKVTSCFAGLLAFCQAGECEILQHPTASLDSNQVVFAEITI